MKKISLLLCVTLVYALALVYTQSAYSSPTSDTVEVRFQDIHIENLPPPAITDNALTQETEELGEPDLDHLTVRERDPEEEEPEEEIQLAHRRCKRHHGHSDCNYNPYVHSHHNNYNYNQTIIIGPTIPTLPLSAICRNNLLYCVTYTVGPVGALCTCHDLFGNIWFSGQRSSW